MYKGILDCLIKTSKSKGLLSLYNGSKISAIGMVPFQGINFLTYNYLNNNYNKNKKKYKNLLFGSLSGICSVTFAYPFDTIKRRMQLSGEFGNKNYINFNDCITKIYKINGIRTFYRGLIPCYYKIFPANGIYFLVIEFLKKQN